MTAASGDDLRTAIRQHLKAHPHLTTCEIARALRLAHPRGAGKERVARQLRLMEGDGEARHALGVRHAGDQRAATRWAAT